MKARDAKRSLARVFLPAIVPALLAVLALCRQPDLVPPHYFLLLYAPLEGDQGRPSRPENLTAEYLPLVLEIELKWDASVDPDTDRSHLIYRVYGYLDGPPQTFYREQDLIGESAITGYTLPSTPYTGTIYFAVTAFDGAAESEPSESVGLDLLPPPEEE